jgi:pimeloyl-ACP methyl ester carboxylesterase
MDNRDTGGSTRMTALGVPDVPGMFFRSMMGARVTPPYTIEDMARDTSGLMHALGHARFHVVGASMGGMIGQTLALDRPSEVLSLTSIMSTPGGRRYSFARPSALWGIMQKVPKDPAAQVDHFVRVFRVIAGSGSPFDEVGARATAEAVVASKPSTAGSARQFAAILDSSGRRRARLNTISAPTLIIHGSHDPLLPVRGARAMAKLVPGSKLVIVDGMGHLIPATRYGLVADAIASHALGPNAP